MTQPRPPPIRAVEQGNASHGGGPVVPRTAFAVAAKFAGLEHRIPRSVDRAPTHPSTAPCHRIPHLGEPTKPARSGADRRATQYNPHNGLWGAV